jgi:undecaprenyl-diphosphatase
VLGVVIVVCALLRWWRVGAFVVFAVAVESGAYRVTTVFVHRQRPDVDRLESLPVNASFPSGHVAASIALYCGLALLVTSRMRSRPAQVLVWLIALAIPPFVALSRLLRGMHNPTDAAAGVLLGIGALLVVLFAARLAGAQAERRATRGADT